ncbi:MAG: NADH-quinone oxidoreductase subunit J [Bdellovibrionia bacterium]
MISWVFSAIALGATLTATVVQGMRQAILSLWIAGLAMGCIFLTVGAETLAVLQWIISTLVAIALFFFAVMFGEYESQQREKRSLRQMLNRKVIVSTLIATAIGAAFAAIIYLGSADLPGGPIPAPAAGNDLASLGRVMVENHIISLEVLALTLFLILVGGGVVARPESGDRESGDNKSETQSGGESC